MRISIYPDKTTLEINEITSGSQITQDNNVTSIKGLEDFSR
jgi:hypothetical protein